MLNRDAINTTLSLIAIVISALALMISYSDYLARKESLKIVATPIKSGYDFKYVDFHCPEICGIAQVRWSIVIYNTSDRVVTVDDPGISLLGDSITEYTYLKGASFDENGVARFPISIDPGKHLRLTQEIGVPLPEKAMKLLKRDFPKGTAHPVQEVQKGLAMEQMDMLGNSVRYIEFVDGTTLLESSQINFNPTFVIDFKTSRNGRFEGFAKWY